MLPPLLLAAGLATSAIASAPIATLPPLREVEVQDAPEGGPPLEQEEPNDGGTPGAQLVPPQLVHDSPAAYPPELAKQGASGEVKLELLIDANGEVEEVDLADASNPAFAAVAIHAATGLQFEPARLGEQPIPVRIFFTYRFEAPRPPPERQQPAPATIKGLVRTRGNRKPIAGATIQIESREEVVHTDAEGRFEVQLPPGSFSLQVSARAHQTQAFPETLEAGETVNVIYALLPLRINPYETVVRADRDRTEVSRVSLEAAEVHDVPGTMGDPFRVVMLLPGVSAMASGVAYPVVRGTQPASTGYFMDGIRVPILFHLFFGPAVIHPDFIDGIDFFPGVAPPEYGRLLGGVIDGHISRPHDDRLRATVYADVINAGAFLEYPVEKTGTNFSVAGRLSYTPWLIALGSRAFFPADAGDLVLDFHDYQARVEQRFDRGRRVRLFAFGSSDVFGLRDGPNGFTSLQSIAFHRGDLRYAQPVGAGQLMGGATWGLDKFGVDSGNNAQSSSISVLQHDLSAYARYDQNLGKGARLLLGADVLQQRARVGIRTRQFQELGPPLKLDLDFPVAIGTFAGAWAQMIWNSEPGWTVIPGARVDNYHLTPGVNHFVFEPRLTALHPLSDDLRLKAGAGLYHQAPTFLISVPVIDVASLRYGIQEALQLDVGLEWKLNRWLHLNVDAYYDPMFRTIELNPVDLGPDSEPGTISGSDPFGVGDLSAHGQAYGLEVLLRHPLGDNWFGWISYSFQRSTRTTRVQHFNAFGQPSFIATNDIDFAFDQTHVLNAVVSYRLEGGWTVGGVVHFNTGRPEIGEQRKGIRRDADGVTFEDWVPVARNEVGRLPAFFRIDARVAKAFAFESFVAEVCLDVLNATVSQEVVGFSYESEARAPQQSGTHPTPTDKKAVALPIVMPILGVRATY